MKNTILTSINRCSMFWVEENDSIIFEKIDTLLFHWIPSKSKLYINSGLVTSMRSKNTELDDSSFKQALINELTTALGFNIKELEQMNDDYDDKLNF